MIAAGGVFGLLAIIINLLQDPELSKHVPRWIARTLRLPWSPDAFAFGSRFMPHLSQSQGLGVAVFALLAITLFIAARKRLNQL